MTIKEILEAKDKKAYEKLTGKNRELCYAENFKTLGKETREQWLNRLDNGA